MAESTSISTSISMSSAHVVSKDADGDEEMVDVDAGDEADELESEGDVGLGAEEDQLEDDVDEPEAEPEEDEVDEEDEEPTDTMAMDDEDLTEDKKRAKLGPGTESRE